VATVFLLPLWDKVARTKSVPDEGEAKPIPLHPPSMLHISGTLSHKGRGKK
jgi:hypothetical protein